MQSEDVQVGQWLRRHDTAGHGSPIKQNLALLPAEAISGVLDALTRRTILMTISRLCRITRDAAIQHYVNQRLPICMSLSGSLFPMGSPSLQRSLALPRWAQCRSVVLLVDRYQISQIMTQDIPRNVEFPTVRALTIKARRPSPTTALKNDLLSKVLHNFPSLDSLELFGISQVSQNKIASISKVRPLLKKLALRRCSAAADMSLNLDGGHFTPFSDLRSLSICNYRGSLRFSGIPFVLAPHTLEAVHFVEGSESAPRGAQEWFVQNIEAARQRRSENVRFTYA